MDLRIPLETHTVKDIGVLEKGRRKEKKNLLRCMQTENPTCQTSAKKCEQAFSGSRGNLFLIKNSAQEQSVG